MYDEGIPFLLLTIEEERTLNYGIFLKLTRLRSNGNLHIDQDLEIDVNSFFCSSYFFGLFILPYWKKYSQKVPRNQEIQ